MRPWHFGLLFVIQFHARCDANFSPNVTVVSCESKRVVIQLVNAAEDGLIFIQGQSTSCSRSTVAKKKSYEFDFELCNIDYDTTFRVVVQKKTRYQTGSDKVIPVMCIVDTSDLYVSGVVFPEEKLDDSSVNKTIRPTVQMRILAPESFESVNEVSLNDQVILSLKLDNPFLDDLDIKAKDCRAEAISLLENECSNDEKLFSNFERKARGDITSGFQAFQPTSFDGKTEVDVAFTCSVAICRGECHKKVCGQVVGWGRRRRDDGDNDVDDDVDDIFEKVTCATKLKVKTPEKENIFQGVTAELKGQLCVEKVTIASVMAVTLLILFVSWIACAYVTSKLRQVTRLSDGTSKPSGLRRLSEKNINFARSVGRRLSHMLNLPVGYNMREPNIMHESIPETDLSPPVKRRDSVTVSSDTVKDINFPDNQQSILPSSQHACLRKRFVDNSSQTDLDNSILTPSKFDYTQQSPVTPKSHSFSSITSISIKSGLTKSRNEPISETNMPTRLSSDPMEESDMPYMSRIDNIAKESIIEYSADDVPKVRNVGLDLELSAYEYTNNGFTAADSDMKAYDNDSVFDDDVISDQIEFVPTHARDRAPSTHV